MLDISDVHMSETNLLPNLLQVEAEANPMPKQISDQKTNNTCKCCNTWTDFRCERFETNALPNVLQVKAEVRPRPKKLLDQKTSTACTSRNTCTCIPNLIPHLLQVKAGADPRPKRMLDQKAHNICNVATHGHGSGVHLVNKSIPNMLQVQCWSWSEAEANLGPKDKQHI